MNKNYIIIALVLLALILIYSSTAQKTARKLVTKSAVTVIKTGGSVINEGKAAYKEAAKEVEKEVK